MAEPIGTLLERGLRHYALGEIERAVSCWREALQKDPENARAREYLTLVRAAVPDAHGPVPLPPGRQPLPPERPSSPPPRPSRAASPRPTPNARKAPARRPPEPPPEPLQEEVLELSPGPAAGSWAAQLDGFWADSLPPGPGDGRAGPELVDPTPPRREAPEEIEVSLDLTPGPAPARPPRAPVEVVGEPEPTPPPRSTFEHSGGPFGRAEVFDVGNLGGTPAGRSAWDVGDSTPSFEIGVDGGDALGLVDGPAASQAVAAPVRLPESPSPRSVADTLMQGARELFDLGDFSGSLELVQKALSADPEHKRAREYLERNQGTLIQMYESKLGSPMTRPRVMLKPDEIVWLTLDHRAGFVLAQIDGTVTYDDIFAVSSLPRLDTAKILAELLEQGVIAA